MGAWSLEMSGRQIQGQILLQCNPGEASGNLLDGNLCPIRTQELCTYSVAVIHLSGEHLVYALDLSRKLREEFL